MVTCTIEKQVSLYIEITAFLSTISSSMHVTFGRTTGVVPDGTIFGRLLAVIANFAGFEKVLGFKIWGIKQFPTFLAGKRRLWWSITKLMASHSFF